MSGEASDGEEPMEEQPSMEALTGEQLKTADDYSQLTGTEYRLTAESTWRWDYTCACDHCMH